MFNQKETVLYKGRLCEVIGIEESLQWGRCYHLKTIFEISPWLIQVPYENAFQNIRKLPSEKEVYCALSEAVDLESVVIERNGVDRVCKPLLDSIEMTDWLVLLKGLLNNQALAKANGKKFLLKEQEYLDQVSNRLVHLYSHVLEMNEEDAKRLLFHTFMEACVE